jgi:hypothetical protein
MALAHKNCCSAALFVFLGFCHRFHFFEFLFVCMCVHAFDSLRHLSVLYVHPLLLLLVCHPLIRYLMFLFFFSFLLHFHTCALLPGIWSFPISIFTLSIYLFSLYLLQLSVFLLSVDFQIKCSS